MKNRKIRVRTSGIIILCFVFTGHIIAQQQLTIEKDISIEAKDDVVGKVDHLVEWFVNNTNGHIQFRNCNSDKITVEGDMPLLLEESPFILSSQFNGNIRYRLDISYSNKQIILNFHDLYHHSRHSINGWDFDLGLLQTNFTTQKQPVLKNFESLSEDYPRLYRYKSDEDMAQLICKKAIETIGQTIDEIQ